MMRQYVETDRISPHYGHLLMALNDGRWVCMVCVPDWAEYVDWVAEEHGERRDN